MLWVEAFLAIEIKVCQMNGRSRAHFAVALAGATLGLAVHEANRAPNRSADGAERLAYVDR